MQVFTYTLTIKIPSERLNGAYSVSEDVTFQERCTITYTHREDEMYYVLEWEYEFRCDDSLFNAAKGHRLSIDNKTLSNVDMKKFGDLFLVNPIHTSKDQTMKE